MIMVVISMLCFTLLVALGIDIRVCLAVFIPCIASLLVKLVVAIRVIRESFNLYNNNSGMSDYQAEEIKQRIEKIKKIL